MTKDKAKTLLDNLIGMVEDNQASDYDEALRMAIAELEQEPCDTISRDAVLKRIAQFSTEEGSSVECQPLYSDVYNMPSVQPSRKGHWIVGSDTDIKGETVYWFTCSECESVRGQHTNYCPDCGAKMNNTCVEMESSDAT